MTDGIGDATKQSSVSAELGGTHPALASEQPRYLQVYRVIAGEIASGRLTPGDRLPAERVLGKRFGMGRATVRLALRELAKHGLIEAAVGRGTFVAGGPLSEAPNALIGLTELALSRGLVPSSRVIASEVRPATMDEADAFQIAPGSPIFHLERLRLFEGIEFALAKTKLPVSRAPEIASVDFSRASLYAALTVAGAGPIHADYVVWAAAADERTAEVLQIGVHDPVLVTSTSAYDATRRLVEITEATFPADRYRVRTVLTRKG